ncbi:MAG: hypothetical protein IKQ07_03690 [Bacteroidaceae bacterium]|nr:hypothetical protein [Bacteroidaceae bacterium]
MKLKSGFPEKEVKLSQSKSQAFPNLKSGFPKVRTFVGCLGLFGANIRNKFMEKDAKKVHPGDDKN